MSRMSQEDDEFEEEVQRQILHQEFVERQKRASDEAWRRRQKRDWKWWVSVVLHSIPVLAFLVFMIRVLWNKYG